MFDICKSMELKLLLPTVIKEKESTGSEEEFEGILVVVSSLVMTNSKKFKNSP